MTYPAAITPQEWERFYQLRSRLFRIIEAVDEGYHKSYEGALELNICFPNIYEADYKPRSDPECYILTLHCYLLVNGRHETYRGSTLTRCLDKLEKDLNRWTAEWKEEGEEAHE